MKRSAPSRIIVRVVRVEGAAGDELGVGLGLLPDIAVDMLHLVGGGGGGEDHGVGDLRLGEDVHQFGPGN